MTGREAIAFHLESAKLDPAIPRRTLETAMIPFALEKLAALHDADAFLFIPGLVHGFKELDFQLIE